MSEANVIGFVVLFACICSIVGCVLALRRSGTNRAGMRAEPHAPPNPWTEGQLQKRHEEDERVRHRGELDDRMLNGGGTSGPDSID